MSSHFLHHLASAPVRAAQNHYHGRAATVPPPGLDRLGEDEIAFIGERDSFYLATVSPTGWPYIQHRGGGAGFLKVLSPSRLAFADYRGNRQLLSTGHVGADARVSLFLMDYPQRVRLKILGRATVLDAREHPQQVLEIGGVEGSPRTERLFLIDVVSFDWNCPQYITPRFTAAEVESAVAGLRTRIAELEAALAAR
jgi:predicted pyridoxine 5'-phosphate oxidase superfamily flavin-nucleotide-binding protein